MEFPFCVLFLISSADGNESRSNVDIFLHLYPIPFTFILLFMSTLTGFLPSCHPMILLAVPSAPPFDSLVSSNSTHASLHLSAWSDNGCPILYFVVQYKEHFLSDWIMLSNNIIPEQNKVFISDLVPSTWYDLSMTAHSEAGQSEAHYLFSTLTPAGGMH